MLLLHSSFTSFLSLFSFSASPIFDWVCKGSVSDSLHPNFFFLFHNFFFRDFDAILSKELSLKPGCKDKVISLSPPNFFSSFSSLSGAYFYLQLVNFLCKELLCDLLFCKAGGKDSPIQILTKYILLLFPAFR
jgi:hypothetical protein